MTKKVPGRSKSLTGLERRMTLKTFGKRGQSPVRLEELMKLNTNGLPTFRSSKIFQPDLYLKTRGLNVSFDRRKTIPMGVQSPTLPFRPRSRSQPASPTGRLMYSPGLGQVSATPLRRGSGLKSTQKVGFICAYTL